MNEAARNITRRSISVQQWFWSVFIPLTFIALFLFVRIPVNVFEASPGEHSSALPDIVWWLSVGGLCVLLLLGALIFVVFLPLRHFASAFLIALAITFWAMDSFFFRAYPQLDGAATRIAADPVRGLLEVFLLAALTVLILKARGRAHMPALAFLLLLAMANAFWVVRGLPREEVAAPRWAKTLEAADLFALSDESNLLIVLLDTFQSDYLADALAAEPSLAGDLDGFIYFPDTLAEAPSTYLSIPSIHSGRMYDPGRTMSGHFERSIQSSFLGVLARAGYQTALVNPIRRLCPDDVACISRDELLRGKFETNLGEALHLLDISLMRSAPEILKDEVFNHGQFLLGPVFSPVNLSGEARIAWDDSRILTMFAERLEVVREGPRAVFMHLMVSHPPYVLDEHCKTRPDIADHFDREGAVLQIRCAMRQVSALLSSMREAGVFRNTLLILLGDHGTSSLAAGEDLSSRHLKPGASIPAYAARLVGSANPLLMVKPPGSSGPVRIDSRQADLTDLPATICLAMGACEWDTGHDLLSALALAPADRRRRFMSYTWEHRFWDLGYIPEVDFYSINGPLGDWDSWKLEEQGIRRQKLGGLSFSEADDPAVFGEGWGGVEYDRNGEVSKRWAIAKQSTLYLDFNQKVEAGNSYQLNFEVYTPDFISDQAISLYFNGDFIAKRQAGEGLQTISYRIPLSLIRDGTDTVTLVFDALLQGETPDDRSHAVNFYSLSIERVALTNDVGRSTNSAIFDPAGRK